MATAFAEFTAACQPPPAVALVLGSGLDAVVDELPLVAAIDFADLPGLPAAAVAGHRGRLCLRAAPARRVLVFHGRVHFYEGHSRSVVERPVCLAHELGARTLILTNASGGIGPAQVPGSLMALRDHLAAMTPWWWRGASRPSPYSPRLLALLEAAARAVPVELSVGVYAGVTGPSYETPAEIAALRALGADAVGMSTVHEAAVAASLGMEVAGLSCVANRAAGLSSAPLSHAEVLAAVRAAAGQVRGLLSALLERL